MAKYVSDVEGETCFGDGDTDRMTMVNPNTDRVIEKFLKQKK